jgi:hypothetical protein
MVQQVDCKHIYHIGKGNICTLCGIDTGLSALKVLTTSPFSNPVGSISGVLKLPMVGQLTKEIEEANKALGEFIYAIKRPNFLSR